jgi:hypothetical protein
LKGIIAPNSVNKIFKDKIEKKNLVTEIQKSKRLK